MKKVVLSFGRMNPPTVGHAKLVEKIINTAKSIGAVAQLYLSHSVGPKDPLSYNDKIKYAKKAFPIVVKSKSRNIIEVLAEAAKKYDEVTIVVGSDRLADFKKLVERTNGKDYSFKKVSFESAGERDPKARGVSGMSASKLRKFAAAGDFKSFQLGMPPKISVGDTKDMYNKIRRALGISEAFGRAAIIKSFEKRSGKSLADTQAFYKKHLEDTKKRMAAHDKTHSSQNKKESIMREGIHDEAHELIQHGDNDSRMYHTSHVPVAKNLEKKFKKGTYDHEKAKKLWKYHADRVADSYAKEHGSKGAKGHHMFSPTHRKVAAKHWADSHHAEMKAGNFHESFFVVDEGKGNLLTKGRMVDVFSDNGKTHHGSVGATTTSIGAAKLAKKSSASFGRHPTKPGHWAWHAKNESFDHSISEMYKDTVITRASRERQKKEKIELFHGIKKMSADLRKKYRLDISDEEILDVLDLTAKDVR